MAHSSQEVAEAAGHLPLIDLCNLVGLIGTALLSRPTIHGGWMWVHFWLAWVCSYGVALNCKVDQQPYDSRKPWAVHIHTFLPVQHASLYADVVLTFHGEQECCEISLSRPLTTLRHSCDSCVEQVSGILPIHLAIAGMMIAVSGWHALWTPRLNLQQAVITSAGAM